MGEAETKADSTDKLAEDQDFARTVQAGMGWTMFVLVLLMKTGWWLMLIAALLVVGVAAMTAHGHPDYDETRKRWMYALYAFCAFFLWGERSRNADVSRSDPSREQVLQAQVNVLTTDLAEARAAKPTVVQQPQVEQPPPQVEQPPPQVVQQPPPQVVQQPPKPRTSFKVGRGSVSRGYIDVEITDHHDIGVDLSDFSMSMDGILTFTAVWHPDRNGAPGRIWSAYDSTGVKLSGGSFSGTSNMRAGEPTKLSLNLYPASRHDVVKIKIE